MIKILYNSSVYLSLVFLAIVLIEMDFLQIPNVFSVAKLVISLLFLFSGFICQTLSWKKIMLRSNYPVTWTISIASIGLSIFGKYIPGKVWMIMGRSTYISMHSNYSIGQLSLVSLNSQFIAIWIGLLFGFTGIILIQGINYLGLTLLVLWFLLTAVIFSNITQNGFKIIINKLFKKQISIPRLSFTSILSVIPWFGLYWLLWALGFYFFVSSLSQENIPSTVALGFPLAGTLGILFIFAPGGIGVREGIMVGYLSIINITLPEAITISAASRLWFLAGEIFIFAIGYIAHRRQTFTSVIHNKVNPD